jgi:hypothetical protein
MRRQHGAGNTTTSIMVANGRLGAGVSILRETRIDRRSIRQLTPTEAAAVHSLIGNGKPKLASHMSAARLREIRHHAPGIVRNEVRRRIRAPVAPAPTTGISPSAPPTHPEWPDAIDRRSLRDLKILSAVSLAARHRRAHGSSDTIGTLPAKYSGAAARRRRSCPSPHCGATSHDGRKDRNNVLSRLSPHFCTLTLR